MICWIADIFRVRAENGNTPLHIAVDHGEHHQYLHRAIAHVFQSGNQSQGPAKFPQCKYKSAVGECILPPVKDSLLEYGAIYDIKFDEGETLREVASDPITKKFLESIDEIVEVARREVMKFFHTLERLDSDEVFAIRGRKDAQRKAFSDGLLDSSICRFSDTIPSK